MQRDGPPPGAVETLISEWGEWLYEKLRPPQPKPPEPIIPIYAQREEVWVFNDETKELEPYDKIT